MNEPLPRLERGSCCDAASAGMVMRCLGVTEPEVPSRRLVPGYTAAGLQGALGQLLEEEHVAEVESVDGSKSERASWRAGCRPEVEEAH